MTRRRWQPLIRPAFRLPAPRREATPLRLQLLLARRRAERMRPRPPAGRVSAATRHQLRIVVAPRIEASFHTTMLQVAPASAPAATAVGHEVERLVEGVATRTERIELGAAPARPVSGSGLARAAAVAPRAHGVATSASAPAHPVPATFPRLAPPARPATASTPPTTATGPSPAEPRTAEARIIASPSPGSALDLEGITESVLATIERRLRAERERRGMI